eukprot:GHVH01001804.1.p1 GENE.GHVH01001804.1~~GHVH01001804.1.p1  ORF type:complete len:541 (+),score=76.41 GHVH01001804.1:47-1669(+)
MVGSTPSYPNEWEEADEYDEMEMEEEMALVEEEEGEEEDEEEVEEGDEGSPTKLARWTEWEADHADRWIHQDAANCDVDAYTPGEIDSRVYVREVPNKGRCLFTRYALKPGDIIFVEDPILSCTRQSYPKLWKAISQDCQKHNTDQDMPASWHYAALISILKLGKDAKRKLLNKWHPPVDDSALSTDVVRLCQNVKYARDVNTFEYERMLNAWRYNCFGHHTDSYGLVCYDKISMMAHCCDSSATWHYGTKGDQFVLRARHHMRKGAEITITYVGDDELLKSKDTRRDRLSSWLFVCKCERCALPVDKTRGIRCPSCGTGVTYFTTDDQASVLEGDAVDKVTATSACEACRHKLDDKEVETYIQLENAYIARLADCSGEEMADAEAVLVEAGRVMISHWVLYELHNILYIGYKERELYDEVVYHLQKKIDFMNSVSPSPSCQMAWAYEEFGDILILKLLQDSDIKIEGGFWDLGEATPDLDLTLTLCLKNRIVRAYETAMNLLLASCGDSHTYTLTSHWKMEFINSIECKALPSIQKAEE